MYNVTFDPISNRADWIESIEFVDDDTEAVITDLDDVTIEIEVRDRYRCRCLSGSTDDGTILPLGGGVMQWHFTADQMRSMCAGTYEVGLIFTRDDITEQELIGTLPVLDGVVNR